MCGHVSPCAHTRLHGHTLELAPHRSQKSGRPRASTYSSAHRRASHRTLHPITKTHHRQSQTAAVGTRALRQPPAPPLLPPILSRTAGAVPTSDPGTGCRYRSLARPALPPGLPAPPALPTLALPGRLARPTEPRQSRPSLSPARPTPPRPPGPPASPTPAPAPRKRPPVLGPPVPPRRWDMDSPRRLVETIVQRNVGYKSKPWRPPESDMWIWQDSHFPT